MNASSALSARAKEGGKSGKAQDENYPFGQLSSCLATHLRRVAITDAAIKRPATDLMNPTLCSTLDFPHLRRHRLNSVMSDLKAYLASK
jgi:hypothetical protein